MDEKPRNSFLESNTLIAISLVAVCWMGWQWYLQKKYPDAFQPQVQQHAPVADEAGSEPAQSRQPAPLDNAEKRDEIAEAAPAPKRTEETFVFEDEIWQLTVSSRGMGIKDVRLKHYKDRELQNKRMAVATHRLAFETAVAGDADHLMFDVKREGNETFVGRAVVDGSEITKTLKLQSESYTIETTIVVTDAPQGFAGLVTYLSDHVEEKSGGAFFLPSFEHQEFFVAHEGTTSRVILAEEDIIQEFSKVDVASIGSQYFAMAFLDRSDLIPNLQTSMDYPSKRATAALFYTPTDKSQRNMKIAYTGFIGPKSLKLLEGIDENLAGLIDFGIFSFIAVYILKLLKGFYALVGNWGVAVILLTILVRIILLPFNIKSFRSMKAMQKIQPEMKALREKYKEEPQKMNQEVMRLMRENNANPLGGCLPMLLQFPVFIALYQVLGQSIELYQAPFMFWIHDLSLKDPWYVLPALMGLTMFVQQKITPTTMDPAQAKVMMFMPVLFTFFMVALPSGLTLYIFVNSLFGIIQQYYFMKEKKQPVVAA